MSQLNNRIPNLFLVGAPKSGTTAIYEFLNAHPEVYMSPIKEPHYFSKDIKEENFTENYKIRHKLNFQKYLNHKNLKQMHIAYLSKESLEDYLQLFKNHKNEKFIGEASTGYLYSKNAAEQIYNFNPNAKIIMCLRNPIERAFSHWKMDYRSGRSTSSTFIRDMDIDFAIKDDSWGGESQTLVQIGLYAEQVKRYFQLFDNNNIKYFIYDDLKNNPKETMNELFNFLEIKSDIYIDLSKKHNASIVPRNILIRYIFNFFRSNFHLRDNIPVFLRKAMKKLFFVSNSKDKLLKSDYKYLAHYFANDIKNLENFLNIDLAKWKKNF